MPQYWLKPFGTSDPPRYVEAEWIGESDLSSYEIISGPATPRKPPQMGRGDLVLFHAVGHVRLYAAGEILETAHWKPHPYWGSRFPWAYPVRVDVWVPNVFDGPRTTEVAPKKIVGRLQAGAPYARLTKEEYETLLQELARSPKAQTRI